MRWRMSLMGGGGSWRVDSSVVVRSLGALGYDRGSSVV
jgi:hypothetical protein